jgi:hypothetical protein
VRDDRVLPRTRAITEGSLDIGHVQRLRLGVHDAHVRETVLRVLDDEAEGGQLVVQIGP